MTATELMIGVRRQPQGPIPLIARPAAALASALLLTQALALTALLVASPAQAQAASSGNMSLIVLAPL